MGILDDFQFDPSTFAGAPAGWLGPLLQPQSGPGFVQSPAQLPPYLAPTSGGATFPQAAAGRAPGAAVSLSSGADGFGKEPGASNPFTDLLASLRIGIGSAF